MPFKKLKLEPIKTPEEVIVDDTTGDVKPSVMIDDAQDVAAVWILLQYQGF